MTRYFSGEDVLEIVFLFSYVWSRFLCVHFPISTWTAHEGKLGKWCTFTCFVPFPVSHHHHHPPVLTTRTLSLFEMPTKSPDLYFLNNWNPVTSLCHSLPMLCCSESGCVVPQSNPGWSVMTVGWFWVLLESQFNIEFNNKFINNEESISTPAQVRSRN